MYQKSLKHLRFSWGIHSVDLIWASLFACITAFMCVFVLLQQTKEKTQAIIPLSIRRMCFNLHLISHFNLKLSALPEIRWETGSKEGFWRAQWAVSMNFTPKIKCQASSEAWSSNLQIFINHRYTKGPSCKVSGCKAHRTKVASDKFKSLSTVCSQPWRIQEAGVFPNLKSLSTSRLGQFNTTPFIHS